MQIQIMLEQQEQEREARLARKLDAALQSVDDALNRLSESERGMKSAPLPGSCLVRCVSKIATRVVDFLRQDPHRMMCSAAALMWLLQ